MIVTKIRYRGADWRSATSNRTIAAVIRALRAAGRPLTIAEIVTAIRDNTLAGRGVVGNVLYANQQLFVKGGRGGRWHPHTWYPVEDVELVDEEI